MGVSAGAAWQAALAAASETGAARVVLIDRPSAITEKKMANGLLAEAGVMRLKRETHILNPFGLGSVSCSATFLCEKGYRFLYFIQKIYQV